MQQSGIKTSAPAQQSGRLAVRMAAAWLVTVVQALMS